MAKETLLNKVSRCQTCTESKYARLGDTRLGDTRLVLRIVEVCQIGRCQTQAATAHRSPLLAPRAPSKLLPLEIVTAIYSSSAIALVSFAKATATEHEGGRYQIGRCQDPDARFILAVSYS
jgi:hypothetical protein